MSFPTVWNAAILGLADYKFWCEVLVAAFLAMVSGNSFNPSCTELALVIHCPIVTALKRYFGASPRCCIWPLLRGSCTHRLLYFAGVRNGERNQACNSSLISLANG